MSAVIEAQHPGRCPECDETFAAGEHVTKHPEGWGHAVCPAAPAPRPVCGECFMEIALNGACGCGVLA